MNMSEPFKTICILLRQRSIRGNVSGIVRCEAHGKTCDLFRLAESSYRYFLKQCVPALFIEAPYNISVSILFGTIALTVIPYRASSLLNAFVNAITHPFAAA
jgi:hypothetical protein